MRKLLSLLLACSMLLSCLTLPAAADGSLANFTRQSTYREEQYSDVNASDWYAENIKAGTEFGIVKGYGDRFGVGDDITLLQCIIIACRLHTLYHYGADSIEQDDFGTLQEVYGSYAAAHGIKCDFPDVDRAATRTEFAAVLSSALPDAALPSVNRIEDGAIPDVGMSADYAPDIYRLYRAGVLTGSDEAGTFLPQNTIVRSEACAIATRMVDPALRKTLTLKKQVVSGRMKEPLFAQQWALANSGAFCLKQKGNAYPVYEPKVDLTYGPYQWINPYSEGESLWGAAGADIGADRAWALYNGGVRETVVALIDTGVDISHEDLKDSIWVNTDEIPDNGIDDDGNGYIDDLHGWNFFDDSNAVYCESEEDKHGTHNAGIIAANAFNEIGVAGVAYSSKVKIMVLKVFGGERGKGDQKFLADAIRYAEANGAIICNMSLSGILGDKDVYEAIQQSKMLIVAAAGNSSMDSDHLRVYPACYELDNIISVANLNCDGEIYSRSNYGEKTVDLAAPGSYILSTIPDNGYAYLTGTSMAAPMVTAAAAMLYSNYKNITVKQVKDILLSTARPNASMAGKCITGGTLDLGAAMEYAARLKNLKAVH